MNILDVIERFDLDYSTDARILAEHAKDASVFEVTPQAVIYPRTAKEISAIIKEASQKYFISVRAGGTCMSGGSLSSGVMLNLTKYFRGITIDPTKKVAKVQAGIYYRDLESAAAEHGLFFAPYTSSKDSCGIGGMLGNNASGEKSIRFGAVVDNVLSLRVILADGNEYTFGKLTQQEFEQKQSSEGVEGNVYRMVKRMLEAEKNAIASLRKKTIKRASGYLIERVYDEPTKTYNLCALFIGSQATLGIITEADLVLTPINSARRLVAIPANDLSELPSILKLAMSFGPESVETFDNNTFTCAKICIPDDVTCATACMGDAHLMILVQFSESTQDETDQKARDFTKSISEKTSYANYIADERLFNSLWNIRRASYKAMHDSGQGSIRAVPCIEDVIVPIESFDVFIPKCVAILKEMNIQYGFHGHIGDGALRIIPLFDMADFTTPDRIIRLSREIFSLVKSLGGHMSADHSDGIIRSPFIKEFYGDVIYALFAEIKRTLDPENIFNPGKKVDGTLESLKKYIIRL